MALSGYQEEGLIRFLNFAGTPLPERQDEWRQLEQQVTQLYRKIDPFVPPLPPEDVRREWVQILWHQAHAFLQNCYDNLAAQKAGRTTPTEKGHTISISHKAGAIYFEVREGKLVPFYRHYQDPTSAFLLMFATLLTGLDDLSKVKRCATCGKFFYKVKRQEYCSKACKEQVHPSRDRTKDYRSRRAAWDSARDDLDRRLGRMGTLYQTTEVQALAAAEKAYRKAEKAFTLAFPGTHGQPYEQGKAFLVRASGQIKRLRRKVKGY